MVIQKSLDDLASSFRNYCASCQQAMMSVIVQAKKHRGNPDLFQKICQVSLASLRLVIMHYPQTAYLSRLTFVLNTANMNDFYNFLKLPRKFFTPINPDTIDDNELIKVLMDNVCRENGIEGSKNYNFYEEVYKGALQSTLEQMNDTGGAYATEKEFIDHLKRNLKNSALEDTSIDTVKIPLRHVPLFEKINNCTWMVVDFSTIALYCKEWNLMDTAKWAGALGQYSAFKWVRNSTLEQFLVGSVALSFIIRFVESVRKLQDDQLTEQGRHQARWNVVTSLAESILFSSIYLNLIGTTKINNSYLQVFAIFAKSLGVIAIVTRPAHKYFQAPAQ